MRLRSLVMIALLLGLVAADRAAVFGPAGMPAVAIPPATGEPREVEGKRFVGDWARALRDTSGRYDAEKLVAEALAAAQAGESRRIFFDRLSLAIAALYLGFAPLGAVHDDAVRYRLPFPLDQPRFLSQGAGGQFSHQGDQHYSFDFAMQVGSPVLAARDGGVARVRDGSQRGGLDRSYGGTENDVLVLHSDGTFAAYVHLRAGVSVREGQRVAQGDRIGFSGHTGFSAGPHLHFAVLRRTGDVAFESVPIRFGVGSPQGFVPEERQFYGGKPRRTVELAVTATGVALSDSTPLELDRGARVPVTVTMTAPGAAPVDVTAALETHFFSPTSWSIVVDGRGNITGMPTPDYAAAFKLLGPELAPPGSTDWGVVVVSYEQAARGHFGFASFPVLIRDAAKP